VPDHQNGGDYDTLAVTTAPVGRASLVTVSGEIDVRTAPRLRAELSEVLVGTTSGPVVVDLTAVTFISSAGLAILVDAHNEAQQRRRPLSLVVDHSTAAVTVPLQTAGLTGLIASYSTLDDALAEGLVDEP